MIKAHHISYDYIRHMEEEKTVSFRALDDITLEIKKGSFVAILGHNGSGKSTFAKHLNSLLIPSEGVVYVNGYDTAKEEFIWDIRKSCGMVFQNPDNQIVATIVEEDVAFGPENIGIPSEEIRRRVDEALEAVNMNAYKLHSPAMLSGGQKQRIAIAGILAMKCQCIVLDEPTAMLDPRGRKEVMETITRLNREEGITIVLITHYMEEAAQADRVVVMDSGKVLEDGTPREIFGQVERLKQVQLDVPQVTEIAYLLRKQGIGLPDNILTIEEMVGAICQLKSNK